MAKRREKLWVVEWALKENRDHEESWFPVGDGVPFYSPAGKTIPTVIARPFAVWAFETKTNAEKLAKSCRGKDGKHGRYAYRVQTYRWCAG